MLRTKTLLTIRHHPSERLSFMTDEHHRVRTFVVSELPRNAGEPLSPEAIAERLGLPLATIVAILDDLQKNLFFLVRNTAGQVNWAFPLTSEKTTQHLCFSSGEYTAESAAEPIRWVSPHIRKPQCHMQTRYRLVASYRAGRW